MKTTELSDQALDTLLRAPVEVADKDFSARLLQKLRAQEALRVRRGTGALWPAWLLALAAVAAGIPWERLHGWLGAVRVQSRELFTQLPQVPVWQGSADAAPDPSLWLPVALALALLFLLLPLAEE
jgi:hypothetical protein